MSNYVLELVRRGAGLSLDGAPKPSVETDLELSPIPMDIVDRERGALVAEQIPPEAARESERKATTPPGQTPPAPVTDSVSLTEETPQAPSNASIRTPQTPPHAPDSMEPPLAREPRLAKNTDSKDASGEASALSAPDVPFSETTFLQPQPARRVPADAAPRVDRVPETASSVSEGHSSIDSRPSTPAGAQEIRTARSAGAASQPDEASTTSPGGTRTPVVAAKASSYPDVAPAPAEEPRLEGPFTVPPQRSPAPSPGRVEADKPGRDRLEADSTVRSEGPRPPQTTSTRTGTAQPSARDQIPYLEPKRDPHHLSGVPARPRPVAEPATDRSTASTVRSTASSTVATREKPPAGREEPQAIQVHIETVEVRAAPPSPPSPRAPEPQGFEGYELVRNYVSWELH